MIPSSKDNILKKIREALIQPTQIPFPKSEGQSLVYQPLQQELEVEFAERLTALQGRFAYCLSKKEFTGQINALLFKSGWEKIYCQEPELKEMMGQHLNISSNQGDLAGCDVAVTGCEYLVARTGSIVMSAAQLSGRKTSVYAPVHICVAYTSQLVFDIKDALEGIKERYQNKLPSLITFATGPSRTADIEKTLVVGVHGPKEVYVFLIDDTE
ncbi:lactate utilization protein B/C [Niabella ginsenosidivorans]|uniref:Lactate utilization protein B/C n=1 Tax=Niabella ginsenosidivorans TaxID=1176587 RepID=A0A1A9I9H5_9BACT|nr:LUD domain-containing protein [Niabella ginsenosidivorans]ANH83321.1 lactate utilization protein B/C [Niabella ginsenosidivorans]